MTPLEAFAIVVGEVIPLRQREVVPLARAVGRIAAAPLHAPSAMPRFDHSAVDGFGIPEDQGDERTSRCFELATFVAAGDEAAPPLMAGKAVRLATGAPVSAGVAAVVMQEHCRVTGRQVFIDGKPLSGANIRRRGEDFAAGAKLVEAGTLLCARHIALLAAAGVDRLEVVRPVRVAVLSTGNELRRQGESAATHEIYDANRPMLLAALRRPWIEVLDADIVRDDVALLASVFRDVAGRADAVISSGGVGGSQTDHLAAALLAAGGSARSLRIAQRPGKPLVVGTLSGAPILGLPGNVMAAMINFYLYGLPMVSARAGAHMAWPIGQRAVTRSTVRHKSGRTDFVPASVIGRAEDGSPLLEILQQGAASLSSLLTADGFIEIGEEHDDIDAGEPVVFHPLSIRFSP